MEAFDAAPCCPSPVELRLERVSFGADEIVITATARRHVVACPECGRPSRRVHSRYRRTLADLPWHGLRVRLALSVRKFFCDTAACPRRIFTERLPATAAPYARRTTRAAGALDVIGLALGGVGGARLAAALGLGTSPSSVLRYVRRVPLPTAGAPRAVGIDDWAWRKGMVYGTIVVDLERGRVLDLLPDREAATVAAWLRVHPEIVVISRDRSDQYAEVARDGAPQATQVADRFHLVKNLGDAVQRVLAGQAELLRLVAKDLAVAATDEARQASAASDLALAVPPAAAEERPPVVVRAPMPTADSRASAASRERRRTRYAEVMALRSTGATIKAIATTLGMGIGTVHRWIHSDGFPERAKQRRRTDPVADAIRRHWGAGCQNAAALWRLLRADGFTGSRRSVQREIERLGLTRDARAAGQLPSALPTARPPSARHLAWLFGRAAAMTTPEKWRFVEALCARSPELARVRTLAQAFVELVVSRNGAAYDAWLAAASDSPLSGFARGLRSDDAAVRAALSLAWSNGPTEGHVNRLKLLKRTMYGRASLDLLRHRVLAAA
jgi:transposase